MKKIKVGMLGLGNVGIGTFKTLQLNREYISNNSQVDIEIVKILTRNINKKRDIDANLCLLTNSPDEILNDPQIDIVVEVLGGIEPATSFMLQAMKNKKSVVTANKAAVAANYEQLVETAKVNNVEFRFEASVGGGIPVLHSITTALGANQLEEILGIVNGTTNYILTQMTDYGLDYDDVLKVAQEKGFAEADPTADVEGIDVANKLSILIALCFGKYIAPTDIPTQGISKITNDDIQRAKEKGCKIKLIACAKKTTEGLEYFVKPVELPEVHPLAGVNNEFNAVFIKGNAVDELMFYGKGAGPMPTGSAVMGDVLDIAKHI